MSLRRSVEELTVLNDISREIGALADLQEVLRRIVSRSVSAVRGEEGVVTLFDDEAQEAGKTLVRSVATNADHGPFHLNEHIVGWMQLHRRPLRIDRGGEDRRFDLSPSDHVDSLLSVPLLVRGRLLGVLTVYNRLEGADFDEGDQRLLSIIGSQSAQIIENARLFEEEKLLRQIRNEVLAASEIQSRLLPADPPTIPGYELAGLTVPAQEVGGDFFDYIPINDNRTGLCVGDVSGKGLPAALLMASAQATLRGQVDPARSPRESIARVNWQTYRITKRGSFLTLFYAELDHQNHHIRFVNAGHNRPFLIRNGKPNELQCAGLAIGLLPGAEYDQGEAALEQGDLVVIYSDGVTEAMNASREQFGEERLQSILQQDAATSPAGLVDRVFDGVREFCGEAQASDDITILVLRRT